MLARQEGLIAGETAFPCTTARNSSGVPRIPFKLKVSPCFAIIHANHRGDYLIYFPYDKDYARSRVSVSSIKSTFCLSIDR